MAKSNHSTVFPIDAPRTALRTTEGSVTPRRPGVSWIVMALLLAVKVDVGSIRDEHVARRVEDRQRRPRLERDYLCRDAARPEDGDLVWGQPDRIAEVGCIQVNDAEFGWISGMHRTAMHRWKA